MEGGRRTEINDAPGSPGAKRENIGQYSSVERRSELGCSVGCMQTNFHHGLPGPSRRGAKAEAGAGAARDVSGVPIMFASGGLVFLANTFVGSSFPCRWRF